MTTGVNIRRSVAIFMLSSLAVLAAWAAGIAFLVDRSVGIDLFLYTAPLVTVFCVFAIVMPSLFRKDSGQLASRFEEANVLTAMRLFLVPPMLVFLVHGHLLWGAIIYGTILLTDVFDGYVARRFGQETVFGLMLDPFADIASTMAAFSWLYAEGVVPPWLLFILIARYSEFFFGITILAAIGRVPKLHATIAGKAAGLIQGLGILTFMFMEVFSIGKGAAVMATVLHVILAGAFASVILSQTRIGLLAVRNTKKR